MRSKIVLCSGLLLLLSAVMRSQTDVDALAKQLQNPLASLISVPFQGNLDFGVGPADGTRFTLNIQPVVPFSVNEKWNLITRTILPVIYQNDVFGPSGNQFGIGDALITAFLSPKESSGGLIWGVGPAFLVPTSTDDLLGAGEFGAGPSVVLLKQQGMLTYGALVNHIWGSGINNTFLNPFIAQNFSGGYALAVNTEITQNWESELFSGIFMVTGSKVFTIGKQACSAAIGPRWHYGNGRVANWGIRAQFVLMFPR